MKKYILTGGPGSGKSSILLGLEQQGDIIVRESAEDFIKYQQARGIKEPWLEKYFQDRILDLQYQREELLEIYDSIRLDIISSDQGVLGGHAYFQIKRREPSTFLDRGILDGLAYYQIQGKDPSDYMQKAIRETPGRYENVFLIQNLGECDTNGVRRENLQEALELERLQLQNYRNAGYKPIIIPAGTLDERIQSIMENL